MNALHLTQRIGGYIHIFETTYMVVSLNAEITSRMDTKARINSFFTSWANITL
jgi:hypothetical protein